MTEKNWKVDTDVAYKNHGRKNAFVEEYRNSVVMTVQL